MIQYLSTYHTGGRYLHRTGWCAVVFFFRPFETLLQTCISRLRLTCVGAQMQRKWFLIHSQLWPIVIVMKSEGSRLAESVPVFWLRLQQSQQHREAGELGEQGKQSNLEWGMGLCCACMQAACVCTSAYMLYMVFMHMCVNASFLSMCSSHKPTTVDKAEEGKQSAAVSEDMNSWTSLLPGGRPAGRACPWNGISTLAAQERRLHNKYFFLPPCASSCSLLLYIYPPLL